MTIQTSYLHDVLDNSTREKIIRKIVNKLKPLRRDYAIAYTGMSGALVAPEIAGQLNKTLWLVRKADDKKCHSHLKVEGKRLPLDYIIIDDLIASGKTIKYIKKTIKKEMRGAGKLKKIVLYASYGYTEDQIDYFKQEFHCPILEV